MQTWARRGVRAALVTGGMLAVGSGVAPAAKACPDRPTPPLGESALTPAIDAIGDGTPRHSGQCFAGELFPDEAGLSATEYRPSPLGTRSAEKPRTWFGTIDPVRDLLPAVEHAPTQEMPAIGRHWVTPHGPVARPVRQLELAGWVVDATPTDTLGGTPGLQPWGGRHAAPMVGTPAEGFHRSLSWAGPIGDVIRGGAGLVREDVFRADQRAEAAPALVIPSGEPTVVEGFDRADGIMELWEGALGRTAESQTDEFRAGLVTPESVDLTSGELAGPPSDLHTIPQPLLTSALSTAAVDQPVRQRDVVPLFVPGEHQEQANELPKLSDLLLTSETSDPIERGEQQPDVRAPLPMLGELHAFGGDGQSSVPAVSRIAQALAGDMPAGLPAPRSAEPVPAYSDVPLAAPVAVNTVDELATAVPDVQRVTENPFRPSPREAARGGMALPVFDGNMPNIAAVQGQTLPTAGIDSQRITDTLRRVSGRL
jgi:hypothetical protein